ncbi:MAG TPA: lipid-A-disaccharide synthase [Caulobacteraceae bacterium]|nr:lipid-A-disaccharide synthase [Caulobacteraceae bacterium]
MSPRTFLITAVEPSADELGAGLMAALRGRLGEEVRFVGVGGPAMAVQGFDSLFDPSDIAVLGAWEGIAAYGRVRNRVRRVVALARSERPQAAVLIDAWGFSQRLAAGLRRLSPRPVIIKYVAPQVWASRPGRARVLARRVDRLLAVNPFDAPYFERAGLATTFVGNQAAFADFSDADPQICRRAIGARPEEPILLVLPGSRSSEVARLIGPFGQAARLLARSRPRLHVVVAPAPALAGEIRARLTEFGSGAKLIEDGSERRSAMRAATVALACSGTVTSQLAAAGTPFVVGYRLGFLTHQAAKILVRTPYVTLINVVAGRFVAPELIQNACTGPALENELALRLDDPELRRRQIAAQSEALEQLRGGISDPAQAAADAVIAMVQARA